MHGRTLTNDMPVNLDEAATLRGLRALHGWIERQSVTEQRIDRIAMRAGSGATVQALAKWMGTGEQTLKSQAASPLLEDIDRLDTIGWTLI